MTRQKYEDLKALSKFQCCCCTVHIQTLTKSLCFFFLFFYIYETIQYLSNNRRDDWEFFQNLCGIFALIGPLIGIEKKNPTYFYAYFIPLIGRFFYYFLNLFSLYTGFPKTSFTKTFNNIITEADSEELGETLKSILKYLVFFVFAIALALEVWIFNIIYRCQNYIEILSLQGREYRQHSKKERKTKNYNTRHTKTDIKSTSFIEKFMGYAFVEWLFPKNKRPTDDFKQQRKTSAVRAAEYQEHKVLQPVEAESAQQLKITTEGSKPEECDINIQSQIVQPKTEENIHVHLEGAQEHEFETVSFKKRNFSKLKAEEPNQQLKIKTNAKSTNSKLLENNLETQQNNHIFKIEEANFPVKLKSNKVVLKQKSSSEKPSNLTPKLLTAQPHFRQAYIPNFPMPKKKIFANIGIQTDETSFNQRIVKNQFSYITYSSESHIQKPFIPCSEYINEQISPITASSGFVSRSDPDFSPFQTFSPNPGTGVTFLFKNDETCAVEIYKNGRKQMLKNSFENEWTPLYFSMATQRPEIGEKAQIHFHQFPENVLFDIFKIIGKPLNEIEINREWKFKIIEENGVKYFKIQTQNGLQLFPENIIVATFLKSMKILAENYLNFEIHEIYIFSNFEITESQKSVIKNAASKVHLKILSFSCNE